MSFDSATTLASEAVQVCTIKYNLIRQPPHQPTRWVHRVAVAYNVL